MAFGLAFGLRLLLGVLRVATRFAGRVGRAAGRVRVRGRRRSRRRLRRGGATGRGVERDWGEVQSSDGYKSNDFIEARLRPLMRLPDVEICERARVGRRRRRCTRYRSFYTSQELRSWAEESIREAVALTNRAAQRWSTQVLVGVRGFEERETPEMIIAFEEARWNFQTRETLEPQRSPLGFMLRDVQRDMERDARRRVERDAKLSGGRTV